MAESYKIRTLIETHHNTFTPTGPLAMNVLQGLNPEYTGIIWDPGNQVFEGRESYDFALNVAAEYLGEVHMKNARVMPLMVQGQTLHWETAWSQIQAGLVDWNSVFTSLKRIGYNGWVMFEDFSTVQSTEEKLKDNLAYAKSLLNAQ